MKIIGFFLTYSENYRILTIDVESICLIGKKLPLMLVKLSLKAFGETFQRDKALLGQIVRKGFNCNRMSFIVPYFVPCLLIITDQYKISMNLSFKLHSKGLNKINLKPYCYNLYNIGCSMIGKY